MKIKAENLSKTYQQGKIRVEALRPCNFEVTGGEQLVITGTSGSGKSTLLHLLGGLEKATGGDILYDDICFSKISQKECDNFRLKNIGFVFQSYNLIPELTAYENIILPLMLENKKPNEDFIKNMLARLDLTDRAEHLPGQLSGGQQQRVAIARALANNPSCLLCDEPTGNLDKKNTESVIHLLFEVARDLSVTLIVVTHDDKIAEMFPRILTIIDGEVGGDL